MIRRERFSRRFQRLMCGVAEGGKSGGTRRVHLHIGLEKTGTTAIQQYLHQNSKYLARSGYLYPVSLKPNPGWRHHLLLAAINMRDEVFDDTHVACGSTREADRKEWRAQILERFVREVQTASPATLLISNEHLSSRLKTKDEVMRVRQFLEFAGPVEFRVHIYLRNQVDMLRSWYSTTVRGGDRRKFVDVSFESVRSYLDFSEVIQRWAAVFGRSQISVYSYDELSRAGQSLIDHFCGVIGLSNGRPSAANRRLNRTLDAEFVELLRRANLLGRGSFGSLSWEDIEAAFEQLSLGSHAQIPEALYRQLVETFAADNARLEKEFFGGRPVLAFPPGSQIVSASAETNDHALMSAVFRTAELCGRLTRDARG